MNFRVFTFLSGFTHSQEIVSSLTLGSLSLVGGNSSKSQRKVSFSSIKERILQSGIYFIPNKKVGSHLHFFLFLYERSSFDLQTLL